MGVGLGEEKADGDSVGAGGDNAGVVSQGGTAGGTFMQAVKKAVFLNLEAKNWRRRRRARKSLSNGSIGQGRPGVR